MTCLFIIVVLVQNSQSCYFNIQKQAEDADVLLFSPHWPCFKPLAPPLSVVHAQHSNWLHVNVFSTNGIVSISGWQQSGH